MAAKQKRYADQTTGVAMVLMSKTSIEAKAFFHLLAASIKQQAAHHLVSMRQA